MVKAVVFDLDDTLISEKEYIRSGYHHISNIISRKYNIDINKIYKDLTKLFLESPENVFNRLFETYDIAHTKQIIIDLVMEYRGHFPNIQFYHDVLPCLNQLKKLDIKTGIITDGFAIAQRQKLKAIQADRYFDEIIVTDEYGREFWKPNPKPFELIKDKLDVEFNELMYVGDNPEKDFYISIVYPINTVRIIRQEAVHSKKPYYHSIKETYLIKSLKEIIDYL